MSKIKNGGLDQYGPERFGRLIVLQSEKCGTERVNVAFCVAGYVTFTAQGPTVSTTYFVCAFVFVRAEFPVSWMSAEPGSLQEFQTELI